MNEFNRANTSARATDQAYVDEGLRAHISWRYLFLGLWINIEFLEE